MSDTSPSSLYDLLGVAPDADPDTIRAAYRAVVSAVHPDKTDGRTAALFRQVQEAYEVLSNPARRARYDRDLAAPPAASRPTPPGPPQAGFGYPPGPPQAGFGYPPGPPPESPAGLGLAATALMIAGAAAGAACGEYVSTLGSRGFETFNAVHAIVMFAGVMALLLGARRLRPTPAFIVAILTTFMLALMPGFVSVIALASWAAIAWHIRARRRPQRPTVGVGPLPIPASPGEIWWAEVPFVEIADSKDRPVLVIGADAWRAQVLMLTSQDKSGSRYYMPVPEWEFSTADGKHSSVKLDRIITLYGRDFRRYAARPSAQFTTAAVQAAGMFTGG